MSILQRVHDAWQNAFSGLGTTRDRSRYTRFVEPCDRSPEELTALYRHNWLARRVVDALPARALAREPEEAHSWPPGFEELNYARWDEGALLRAACLGRLYGGAGLLVGYAGGGDDLTQPAPDSGGVAFLDVVTRHEVTVAQAPGGGEWREQDPRSPQYQRPLVWEIGGQHRLRGLKIHTSRFIWFGGSSRPPQGTTGARRESDYGRVADPYQDWSDSVLLSVWTELEQYGKFWQSLGSLVDVASVGVLKMHGLFEMLGQESQETVRRRVDVLNMGLSSARLLLLDAERSEDYHREGVSFAGLPELSQEQQLAVAGAVGMPVTELFGRAPAGLNATGESDAQMWVDRVTQYRRIQLQPRAERLAAAIAGTATYELEFPPVEIPSEDEAADLRAKEVQTDYQLWQMGVVTPDEVRKARRQNEWVELTLTTDAAPEPEPEPAPEAPSGDEPPPAPGA